MLRRGATSKTVGGEESRPWGQGQPGSSSCSATYQLNMWASQPLPVSCCVGFTASGNLESINTLTGEGRGSCTSEAGGCLGGPCWQSLGAMGVHLSDPRLLRWETPLSRAGPDSRGERQEPWQRKGTAPAGSQSQLRKRNGVRGCSRQGPLAGAPVSGVLALQLSTSGTLSPAAAQGLCEACCLGQGCSQTADVNGWPQHPETDQRDGGGGGPRRCTRVLGTGPA